LGQFFAQIRFLLCPFSCQVVVSVFLDFLYSGLDRVAIGLAECFTSLFDIFFKLLLLLDAGPLSWS
jgi:hypothetical protein